MKVRTMERYRCQFHHIYQLIDMINLSLSLSLSLRKIFLYCMIHDKLKQIVLGGNWMDQVDM